MRDAKTQDATKDRNREEAEETQIREEGWTTDQGRWMWDEE